MPYMSDVSHREETPTTQPLGLKAGNLCRHTPNSPEPAPAAQTKVRRPKKPPIEFSGEFSAADHESGSLEDSGGDSDAQEAVWEYNVGGRGRAEWRRYPGRIEGMLENMSSMSAPKFMYRPGHPDQDGMSESGERSALAPAGVATCHVSFGDMTEREVYTGAWRNVRRNGLREALAAPVRERASSGCPLLRYWLFAPESHYE
jgi:hypothetical protein